MNRCRIHLAIVAQGRDTVAEQSAIRWATATNDVTGAPSVAGVATDRYSFTADVWEHDGAGAWHFVSLPDDIADEIEQRFGHRANGFGSLRVDVTIGRTRWQTSIFPDSKRATYVLPVKKAVRTAEGLSDGSTAPVALTVIDD